MTGWQPLSREPAHWAFSGDADYPVLDVLSSTSEGQQSALATGILSTIRSEPVREPWNPWLTVMLGGVTIAFLGVGGRLIAGRKAVQADTLTVTEAAPQGSDVSEPLPDDTSEVILIEEAPLTAGPEEPTPIEEPSTQPVVSMTDTPLPGLEPPPSVPPPLLPEPEITVAPEAPKRLSLDATQWEEEDPDSPLWDDDSTAQLLPQETEKK
jgi:hypothetical protein